MKSLLFTLFITIGVLSLHAQNQYATTSDGKRVLLKSNGTWEYVKDNASTTNSLYSGGSKSTTTSSSQTTNTTTTRSNSSSGRTSAGRTYIRGPRGGCYYSNGNKTYVDRSLCN